MTHVADAIWIKAGISSYELDKVKGRAFLYAGICCMGALSLSFATMALMNWF